MRLRRGFLAGLIGAAAVVLSACTPPAAPLGLTIHFAGMDAYVGNMLEARLVTASSGAEVGRKKVAAIAGAEFSLAFSGLDKGKSYRVDFYVDVSENGSYDVPPADHAWRLAVPALQGNADLSFSPTTNYVDIAWPSAGTSGPAIDGVIGSAEYRNTSYDAATGMTVYWQNDSTTLTVGLSAPGKGWVAIGFDPEDQMAGADIIIGYVSGGVLTIDDHYGSGPRSHSSDAHDDVLAAAGREVGDTTTIEFSIPLNSGDASDKPLAPGATYTVILSYHATADSLTAYHSDARSTTHITLD